VMKIDKEEEELILVTHAYSPEDVVNFRERKFHPLSRYYFLATIKPNLFGLRKIILREDHFGVSHRLFMNEYINTPEDTILHFGEYRWLYIHLLISNRIRNISRGEITNIIKYNPRIYLTYGGYGYI